MSCRLDALAGAVLPVPSLCYCWDRLAQVSTALPPHGLQMCLVSSLSIRQSPVSTANHLCIHVQIICFLAQSIPLCCIAEGSKRAHGGKTTPLRDIASQLANRFGKRVVVVDTRNEIGGDGVVPHGCLGKARRMPVHAHTKQHEVMLQAVQNHNPQVPHYASFVVIQRMHFMQSIS